MHPCYIKDNEVVPHSKPQILVMDTHSSLSLNSLEAKRNLLAQERTRLAAERTFLSWIRTGLASVGIGIALARFVFFQTASDQSIAHLVGQLLILWGLVIFIFAWMSYHRSCKKVEETRPYGSFFMGLTLATFILILLTFILFWIVVE